MSTVVMKFYARKLCAYASYMAYVYGLYGVGLDILCGKIFSAIFILIVYIKHFVAFCYSSTRTVTNYIESCTKMNRTTVLPLDGIFLYMLTCTNLYILDCPNIYIYIKMNNLIIIFNNNNKLIIIT
jgi:hypothetical protein